MTSKLRAAPLFAPLVLWTVLASGQDSPSGADENRPAISFLASVDEALAADGGRRPTIVVFGAAWCGYCHKLDRETFTDEALAGVAQEFAWVKIDIDDQPEQAARYRVTGVPHVVVLDAQGRSIGAASGFMPAEKFLSFVRDSIANPQYQETPEDWLKSIAEATNADERQAALQKAVESLASPERAGRKQLMSLLEALPKAIWPDLLALMGDERLAVRAAAGQVLAGATKSGLPFLPFAEAGVREKQRAAWREWLDKQDES
jgi:thioredoxin-related protein